jgi:hypothetical protein
MAEEVRMSRRRLADSAMMGGPQGEDPDVSRFGYVDASVVCVAGSGRWNLR